LISGSRRNPKRNVALIKKIVVDMPRQSNMKQVEAKLEKEVVDGKTYDVLYVDGKEIIAFDLENIEKLNMEHSIDTMLEAIQRYFKGK
jgi:translation elongation factor P/translation initiation factor 5A